MYSRKKGVTHVVLLVAEQSFWHTMSVRVHLIRSAVCKVYYTDSHITNINS